MADHTTAANVLPRAAVLRATGPESLRQLRVITLDQPRVIIGRGRDCDACLPDSRLSLHHAVFTFLDNCWHVESIGTSGVVLNTVEIPKRRKFLLQDKDCLEFARVSGMKYIFRTRYLSPSLPLPPAPGRTVVALSPGSPRTVQANNGVREVRMPQEQLRSLPTNDEEPEPYPCSSGAGNATTGTLEPSAVIQQMEQELSCSICYELLVSASLLSCGHTFCGWCLDRWMTSMVRSCPLCRAVIIRSPISLTFLDRFMRGLLAVASPELLQQYEQLSRDRSRPLAAGADLPQRIALSPLALRNAFFQANPIQNNRDQIQRNAHTRRNY